ncbi:REPLICATION FACTOR A 1 RFA1 [Salix viminalis]|uniref:REPLICATION FACTOR A 1 RFA1 n=1 Tax=Salix viminalis TaxID=40686 RepID=A0A9Q0V6H8_SALVM|nr:REPLICATION FACTOR A 1 RFA1 [Salix viminalis]
MQIYPMHPACSESQNHGGNLEGCAEFLTDCSTHSKLQKSLCSYEEQAPARIIPINALNPYQERWAIKGRVTAKGDLCCYNNTQGDGKVFYCDLLDSEGGQIRVACFNAVVDCFYDVMEVGYLISKDSSIPQQQFKPISEIEISENNSILDVFRVVVFVNPSFPLLRKNGMETQERILNLKDGSGRTADYQFGEILATREGQKLKEMVDSGVFPVKAGKVSDFNGKSLGTILYSAQLFINPDIPEAHAVKDWFDHGERDIAWSLLQVQIQDYTRLTWVTAFQDSVEETLGYPAKILYMKLKIKEEMYGDDCQASICFYAPFRLRRVPCVCNILQIEFYQQTLSVVHLVGIV